MQIVLQLVLFVLSNCSHNGALVSIHSGHQLHTPSSLLFPQSSAHGVGMGGVPSGTFASQNPQLARMSAESQRRSFAYIPPEGRTQQPPQARLQDDQRRGGENGGVPRGSQATEGPKMVG